MITGKWPSSSICPVHTWSQTYYQQSCIGITERRYRPGMVIRVPAFNIIQKVCQTRAGAAVNIKHSCKTYSRWWDGSGIILGYPMPDSEHGQFGIGLNIKFFKQAMTIGTDSLWAYTKDIGNILIFGTLHDHHQHLHFTL